MQVATVRVYAGKVQGESSKGTKIRGVFWLVSSMIALSLALAVIGDLIAPRAEAQETGEAGLKAEYFDQKDLSGASVTRTDANVDFSWGKGSPDPSIAPNTFSARWTGQVEAPSTGTYTFHVKASDGVRLWVNGELIIDRWTDKKKAKERSGAIELEAYERYEVELEYYENTGPAKVQLLWSSPDLAKQVVPKDQLFLPDTSPPLPSGTERWSDPATWGGEVPQEGETVTVPADKTVLLDESSPPLEGLQIDGTLVFEDKDLTLDTDWILVHGKLQIGTEEEPFRGKAKISLTGTDPNADVMGMGAKVLGVMGGTLEVHGEERTGWTRLDAIAEKGSNKLTLEEASLSWRPGDKIVVSSTDYDPAQAEEATITAVSGNTITLDKALAYTHWGEVQTFDGQTVDERAEVALLTRNIAIEGEEASSASGFGGQLMVMGGGTARIEGTELTRMGQKSVLSATRSTSICSATPAWAPTSKTPACTTPSTAA